MTTMNTTIETALETAQIVNNIINDPDLTYQEKHELIDHILATPAEAE
jgi:hypothetical protein